MDPLWLIAGYLMGPAVFAVVLIIWSIPFALWRLVSPPPAPIPPPPDREPVLPVMTKSHERLLEDKLGWSEAKT